MGYSEVGYVRQVLCKMPVSYRCIPPETVQLHAWEYEQVTGMECIDQEDSCVLASMIYMIYLFFKYVILINTILNLKQSKA